MHTLCRFGMGQKTDKNRLKTKKNCAFLVHLNILINDKLTKMYKLALLNVSKQRFSR